MTQAIESIAELFERASQMAAERLRECYGAAMFEDLLRDAGAEVRMSFALKSRLVVIFVNWPARFGEKPQMPVSFKLPEVA